MAWKQAACPQGEPLTWLGLDGRTDEHWFGTGASPELCARCWAAAHGPRQFADRPEPHETLLGRLPLASPIVQQVLPPVRPWSEPAPSYEKNQLGLSQVFRNGLRLTWVMSLLADAVVILRARAIVGRPPGRPLLDAWTPTQLSLELPTEDAPLF